MTTPEEPEIGLRIPVRWSRNEIMATRLVLESFIDTVALVGLPKDLQQLEGFMDVVESVVAKLEMIDHLVESETED